MIQVATVYEAGRLHAALTAAGIAFDGVSTSPSGTTVHCAESARVAVMNFLGSYSEPAPIVLPSAEERLAALEAAVLDLLLGG